jgi:hypothetical protein
VANPDVQLDAGFLNKLTEAVRGSLQLTLREGETEIARESFEVRLLPPSQWSGTDAAPELLAAFVRPNDPAIDQTLRVAAAKLEAAGRSTALDGYASGNKSHVWEVAESIWAAAVEVRIRYVLPPASFEKSGQKVPRETIRNLPGYQSLLCGLSRTGWASAVDRSHHGPCFCRSLVQSGSVVRLDDR